MRRSSITINDLNKEPYSAILGFPKASKSVITSRIRELKTIGVSRISFEGKTQICNLNVLGKGYVGVVVLAKRKNNWVALKIRRTDSQRSEMKNEARLLDFVNNVGVGPKIITSSKNFIVMEYLDGDKIGDWIKDLSGKNRVKKLKTVVRKILEDCYMLDMARLDHGELSSITKHVIVGNKITLIDFESSSLERRVSNVTSATQGIFIGSGISKIISRNYKIPPLKNIIKVLREYKYEKTRQNFENILKILKL